MTETVPTKIDSGIPQAFYVPPNQGEFDYLEEEGFLTPASDESAQVLAGNLVGIVDTEYRYAVDPDLLATMVMVFESESSGTYPHFNTGINIYNSYEVTFLLDDGSGTGYVGLLPIPEPTISGLAGLLLMILFTRAFPHAHFRKAGRIVAM